MQFIRIEMHFLGIEMQFLRIDIPFLYLKMQLRQGKSGFLCSKLLLSQLRRQFLKLGNEPVRVNGKVMGRVTSGGYGVSIRASIAFAYLPVEFATVGMGTEILVFGNWITGKIMKGPLYDPKGLRIRI
jgi:glycine cleavage system aminomethyltransferase T